MRKILALFLLIGLPFTLANFEEQGSEDTELEQVDAEVSEEEIVEAESVMQESVARAEEEPFVEEKGYVYTNKWQFLEDKILLTPGYISAALWPLKGAASLGALALLFGFDSREMRIVRVSGGLGLNTEKELFGMRSGLRSLIREVFGQREIAPIVYYMIMALGGYAGYKVADWTINTLVYAHRLRPFLRHWHDRSKEKTPKVFHDFFDAEYEKFKDSEVLYLLRRTKKVIALVEKAVALHKKGIKFKELPAL